MNLLPAEIDRLTELETTIERGLQTFVEVGAALLEIRDGRLYRVDHGTFEDYCRERWGMTRDYAYKQIGAANVYHGIQSAGLDVAPATERQARPLTSLPAETQPEVWQRAVDTAPDGRITAAHVAAVVQEYRDPQRASHQLINQSENNEWYTPAPYVDAARVVMGGIDLDPASNAFANQTIKAAQIFTIDDDGFSRPWTGRVWLNPPYGYREGNESNQAAWSRKLITEYHAGSVNQAVLLVNAVPGNRWFAPLWDFPICFPDHRIRFYNEETEAGQPTHSNALVYLGPRVQQFATEFGAFGVVAVRYDF